MKYIDKQMNGKLTPYLLERVLSLRPSARVALRERIDSSLVPSVPPEVRLGLIADRLASVSGVDVRERRDATREATLVRTVFAYVARVDGFTLVQVGRFVGRDHSTVVSYESRMRDALACPAVDSELVRMYYRYVKWQS